MTAAVPIARRPRLRGDHELVVLLRREDGGPVTAIERVTERDLGDALAELWFEAFVRRGRPDVPCASVQAELRPVHRDTQAGGRYCAGFTLEVPETGETRCVFPRSALQPVASRAARALVRRGELESEVGALWELRAERPGERSSSLARSDAAVRVTSEGEGEPLLYRSALLPPLLAGAQARGGAAADEADYPVFYTRDALAKAERVSRKGGAETPPVETGGLLVGSLCSCPETGELFAVVVDVLEAHCSEATTYSLSYSGETWSRIQAVLRARRAHPATRSQRILGQCHGHSFLPLEGAPPCEACAQLEVCSRTTAFLSADDLAWCRAVFHREPWQLSHVFGWNARNEPVDAFFGQRGGTLIARGYRVVDAFPEEDP